MTSFESSAGEIALLYACVSSPGTSQRLSASGGTDPPLPPPFLPFFPPPARSEDAIQAAIKDYRKKNNGKTPVFASDAAKAPKPELNA